MKASSMAVRIMFITLLRRAGRACSRHRDFDYMMGTGITGFNRMAESSGTRNGKENARAPKAGLPPAARRALAEAEARRAAAGNEEPAREIGGRGGADPARYGDWEVKGIAVDF
jgi:hypothetical protein